ncbi:helix-turn-helix domain-containing protein [Brevibacillus sp. NRRL NRS-603]
MTKPTKKKLRATVLRMLEEGKSQEEVAHILDMSRSYVSNISLCCNR